MHFFSSKEDLFAAVLEAPAGLARALITSLAEPGGDIGERFTRAYLELWENPPSSRYLLAAFRSIVSSAEAAAVIRRVLEVRILDELPAEPRSSELVANIPFAGTQLLGVAVARHIVRADPIASLSLDELVRRIAPSIQRTLAP